MFDFRLSCSILIYVGAALVRGVSGKIGGGEDRRSDFLWSGAAAAAAAPVPYLYEDPYENRDQKIRPGSPSWIWGERVTVKKPEGVPVQVVPVSKPHHGGQHSSVVVVKQRYPDIPGAPVISGVRPPPFYSGLSSDQDLDDVVSSLGPSMTTTTDRPEVPDMTFNIYYPSTDGATTERIYSSPYEPIEGSSSTSQQPDADHRESSSTEDQSKSYVTYNFPYRVPDSGSQQVYFTPSGPPTAVPGHVTNVKSKPNPSRVTSSLTILDPDDPSRLTLVHGNVLVSSDSEYPVPNVVIPSGHHVKDDVTLEAVVAETTTAGTPLQDFYISGDNETTLTYHDGDISSTTSSLEPTSLESIISEPVVEPLLAGSSVQQQQQASPLLASPAIIGNAVPAPVSGFASVPSSVADTTVNSVVSSDGTVLFIVQIVLPVVAFVGITFLVIFLLSQTGRRRRRRRRRDTRTALQRFLDLPDGFPLDILGR